MDETVDSDDALLPLIKVEDAEEDVKEKGDIIIYNPFCTA